MNSNNWCSCFAKVTTPPPCSNNGKCVKAPHMLVTSDNSVFPCGTDDINGIISLTGKIVLSDNGESPVYTIKNNSVNLLGVTIDENEIKFTGNYDPLIEGSSYLTAQIEYKVTQGDLSDTGIIDIIFKSRCIGVEPETNEYCDPCLGIVQLPDEVFISSEVSINSSTNNLKITG